MRADQMNVHYDISRLQLYRKKDLPRSCIKSLDVAQRGSKITLLTLEGPVEITAGPDTYIMVGPCADIYPITRQKFEDQYRLVPGDGAPIADLLRTYGWDPAMVSRCRLKKPSCIYARPVPFEFRVYVKEHDAFISGTAGDYYAVAAGDTRAENPYIIRSEVMDLTYEQVPND